jgi:hypothetical protein
MMEKPAAVAASGVSGSGRHGRRPEHQNMLAFGGTTAREYSELKE